jgi:hypothetical protein
VSATDRHLLPQRDPLAERVLLDRGQRLGRVSISSWPTTVESRLEVGQALYGDQWADRSPAKLLDEVAEEAVDLAAWACLAVQALAPSELDRGTIATAGEMIARAIGAAAEAHACVVAAQAAIQKATR